MSALDTLVTLTDEQRAFRGAVREFCRRECGTREQQIALTDHFRHGHNAALYATMADLGWLGVSIPSDYGGSSGGMTGACILLEETARGLAPISGYGTTVIVASAYERFGTTAQKSEVLGEIMCGSVEAISMSEPDSGSDVASLNCSAQQMDGGFSISGRKTWCSHAHFSKRILLVARTSREEDPHHGITMLSVPVDTDGLELSLIDTMGYHETNDVVFTDCWVPECNVLGTVDQGWSQLVAGLNVERLAIAAGALGLAQRAFDDVLAYVKERRQFGRPIGKFQALQHRLADLATDIECTRMLVYGVAAKVDAAPGRLFPREASMAKLKASETAKHVALEGLQMMGGYGYATEFGMERYVRLSLMLPIFGGTSEIQRQIIARTYGL
jgi:isovaleryl-CoA dehydrogenase